MKTLLPQFDELGWKKLQEMAISYGRAFFCKFENFKTQKIKLTFFSAPEECKRRIVKKEDEDAEAEVDIEDATVTDDQNRGDVYNARDGQNGRRDIPDSETQHKDEMVNGVGDTHELDVERNAEGTEAVQAHDEKSNAETILSTPSPTTATAPSPSTVINVPIEPLQSLPFSNAPLAPILETNGGNPPFSASGRSPTAPTMTAFQFPDETQGTHGMGSLNPYSCDFGLTTNNWSAFPAQLATPSLNVSADFWFGRTGNNPSNLTFTQGKQLLYCSISVI